jgi:hypothetical protein
MADFTIKQGDTSPALEATLKDRDGNAVNLTGASVQFHLATTRYKNIVDATGTLVNASEGKVKYEWQADDTSQHGDFFAEFEVTYADSTVETFPNDGYISVEVKRHLDA